MTHEEFLNTLLAAHARQPEFPTSGRTLEEAIARWVAYAATSHWWIYHRSGAGSAAAPSVTRVWSRWHLMSQTEDVDISLPTTGERVAIKITVNNSADQNTFTLRLNDFRRGESAAATGLLLWLWPQGRFSIRPYEDPYVWPLPVPPPTPAPPRSTRRREPETLVFRPEPCCRRALANIRHIKSSWSVARGALSMGNLAEVFGIVTSAGGRGSVAVVEQVYDLHELSDSDWDDWARVMAATSDIERAQISDVAEYEVIGHLGDANRERFWTIIHDAAAFRQ